VFAYFIVLPSALGFLLNFGSDRFERNLLLTDTISFVTNLLIWVGVSFEMPVIVYALIKLNIVSARQLASWRRYAIIIIAVAAAVITPTPDPLNMSLVAIPMYLLFELGIIMGRIGTRGR
jgi:sec-independent protein translocase protein TatC